MTYGMTDSGARDNYASGMVRESQEGKARFDLLMPEGVPYGQQMLTRFARWMAQGAEKYAERNWEKGTGSEELSRAKASAFRHFVQWFCDEQDEDHAAAVFFNIMQVEFLKWRQAQTAVTRRELLDWSQAAKADGLDALPVGTVVRIGNHGGFMKRDGGSWGELAPDGRIINSRGLAMLAGSDQIVVYQP